MRRNIILSVLLALGLCRTAQSQTLDQVSGTWSIIKMGMDVDNQTNNEMGITQKWVISKAGGNIHILICHIYPSGRVDDNLMKILRSSYKNGILKLSTQTTDRALRVPITTDYEISVLPSGKAARGKYTEINKNISGPSSKNDGVIQMLKLSDSTKSPKAEMLQAMEKRLDDELKSLGKKNPDKLAVGETLMLKNGNVLFKTLEVSSRFMDLTMSAEKGKGEDEGAKILKKSAIIWPGTGKCKIISITRKTVKGQSLDFVELEMFESNGSRDRVKDFPKFWVIIQDSYVLSYN